MITTFALGLLLAMVFNDERMRGRKIYRSLIIIPYALPAFMTALVWRGLFNRTFGINRWLGIDIGWLESPALAMFSLILVNLWLGYPYMFLVCTGALQSIPTDLKEAAYVDGATGLDDVPQDHVPAAADGGQPAARRQLRLQLQQLHARLPADAAAGRAAAARSAGSTDLLITWTYRIALDGEPKRQGLAAALSVLIFIIVAALSAIGFKATKTFEEVR